MIYLGLRNKIRELVKSKATLLWLEGSKYEQVNHVQMKGENVLLFLSNGTIMIIKFEKYTLTSVGIQFWNKGKPGVLYKWDLPVPIQKSHEEEQTFANVQIFDDDPTPPDIAA